MAPSRDMPCCAKAGHANRSTSKTRWWSANSPWFARIPCSRASGNSHGHGRPRCSAMSRAGSGAEVREGRHLLDQRPRCAADLLRFSSRALGRLRTSNPIESVFARVCGIGPCAPRARRPRYGSTDSAQARQDRCQNLAPAEGQYRHAERDSWSENQTTQAVAEPHRARWPYGLYSCLSNMAAPASHASADVRNRLDDCRTLLPSSSS